jgi:NDP-mannose synthase
MSAPIGLVMAGGRGERMKRSGAPVPKPLVTVRGATLLERNVWALLRSGIADVHVAVAEDATEIRAYVAEHIEPLVRASGGTFGLLLETAPMGNAGGARLLQPLGRDVVMVYADNLSDLPLDRLAADHREHGAAVTLAVHEEPIPVPYGVVDVDDTGRVLDYREKPRLAARVASAISVLGVRALDALGTSPAVGLSDLVIELVRRGELVRAFPHRARWIDVNDTGRRLAAAALIAEDMPAFERWARAPHARVVTPRIRNGAGVLVRREGEIWRLPVASLDAAQSPRARTQALLPEALTLGETTAMIELDDLGANAQTIRIHSAAVAAPAGWRPPAGWRWLDPGAEALDPGDLRLLCRCGDLADGGA